MIEYLESLGFSELECGILFLILLFVAVMLWYALGKRNGGPPRWGE